MKHATGIEIKQTIDRLVNKRQNNLTSSNKMLHWKLHVSCAGPLKLISNINGDNMGLALILIGYGNRLQ